MAVDRDKRLHRAGDGLYHRRYRLSSNGAVIVFYVEQSLEACKLVWLGVKMQTPHHWGVACGFVDPTAMW
jgi:hypothetical protein